MTAQPGADELRIRSILRQHGVGPDAEPSSAPTEEWWKQEQPETVHKDDEPEEEQPAGPGRFEPQPDYWPHPHIPAALHRTEIAISPRTRAALYNASAAGAGWALGLYQPLAAAVTDCGQHYSISGAIVLGVGGSLAIAHLWDRRTRHWWPPLAWCARIPLATAVLALLLWAPAA